MSVELMVWAGLLALFIIVEALTAQLVTIWFAAGSLAALIAHLCGAKLWLEIVLFIVVSAVALIATRPLVKKFTHSKIQPTNADRCIGAEAVVTEDINNIEGTGCVVIDGITWSARSEDGEIISKGKKVVIKEIKGVRVVVSVVTANV